MFQSAHDAYVENRVLSAEPLELVHMLYQGAIGAVQDARHYLADGKIIERARAISKACTILIELTTSLNMEAGGELAKRLASLYDYMRRRLLEANFRQSDEPLGEVLGLLATLTEGWAEIGKRRETPAAASSSWSEAPAYPRVETEAAYSSGSWSL
ncbi:MAG TPA: flagellar export chaperone FliS [Bryobacteraceae bacterium]|nr:flagellar export chaperone FliS [Bryobacteraceae bacterium]